MSNLPQDDLELKVTVILLNIALKEAEAHKQAGEQAEMRKALEAARTQLRDVQRMVGGVDDDAERAKLLNPPDSPDGINLMRECRSLGEGFRDALDPEWSQLFGALEGGGGV